jgi:uncharacterized membrane protein YtjA (UPF0391 family)
LPTRPPWQPDLNQPASTIPGAVQIVAAVLGFGGIAAGASEIARMLFFVFVIIFLVTLIMGMMRK